MENWYWGLSHIFVTVFLGNFAALMVNPVITDVTVEAVCHGKDECSLAIYLTGFQQAITGLGSVVMMPLIGNLADTYGSKNLLRIPMTLIVIPQVILAWNRTTNFFYAYYAFRTLTAMVTDGGTACLSYVYLADNVPKAKRSAAFAALFGIACAANVCGNLAARLLSPAQIFQVAAVVSTIALLYMTVFLKDIHTRDNETLEHPLLKPVSETNGSNRGLSRSIDFSNLIPSPKDIFRLFGSSTTVSIAAFVVFFNSLAEDGAQAFLMYFLKARFHFNKDQFAILFLIINIGASLSNAIFMPIFGPIIGEETVLSFALFCGFISMLLDSIAWSALVPYGSAVLGMFFTLSAPCIRGIISKQVGPNEQGIAQGCISGITSFAAVISPLMFSPLSALFLSERAPFNFPGFCILCVGFAYLTAFILSILMQAIPHFSRESKQ